MANEPTASTESYAALLIEPKQRIEGARLKAALSVNRELVLLYWSIGRDILTRQSAEGWGTKIIDRLAADLRQSFPEMTGLSARNLKYMRAFAEAWLKPGLTCNLCNRLLHYCRGGTTPVF